MNKIFFFLAALAAIFVSERVSAQGVIQQFGPLVAGHNIMSQGNNRAVDAGDATIPTVPGTRPTGIGVVNSGLGYCQWTPDPGANTVWNSLCWGFNGSGGGLLSYNNVGTPPSSLTIAINGSSGLILDSSGAHAITQPCSDTSTLIATDYFAIHCSPSVSGGIVASNNAVLMALNSTAGAAVTRLGFYSAGDAPPIVYYPSSSPCSLNSGSGDNGSQVPSADGKCWLASFPTIPDDREWGTKHDGVTDNTITAQAAINYVSVAGGALIFGPGTVCLKTGPLTVTARSVTLQGQNRGSSPQYGDGGTPVISACNTDTAILSMSGDKDTVQDLQLVGSPRPGTSKDVIALNSGCNECTVLEVQASGGRYAMNATGAYEVYILDSSMDSTYGNAIMYFQGTGGYVRKAKLDQAGPAATPAAGSLTNPVPAWIASHNYSPGALAATAGYILQATAGGTSGGTPPAVPSYGLTTVDGSVTWGLLGATTYYGLQCDTGCGFQLTVEDTDFSSADSTCGLGITNTLSGDAPHGIVITNDTFGENLYNNICATGYLIQIANNIFGGGLQAYGGTAISLFATGDDNIVSGNLVLQGGPPNGTTGVFLGGNNVNVENNIFSVLTGVSVAANIQHFRIIGNSCFSGFGVTQSCVFIANGTSDYYTVALNDAGGSTSSIYDGGSGTHKIILDEDSAEYGLQLPSYIRIPTPVATIVSGFGTGSIVDCAVAVPGTDRCISGSAVSGRIIVGNGGDTTGIISLGTAYESHFPNCTANDESSGVRTYASALGGNPAQIQIASVGGPWGAGDHLTYVCGAN